MFKVIVADDETFTLKRLCNMLAWEKYGFEFCGMFPNGESVMEYIAENPVDLIITDIEMPQISGLKLAKECYSIYPNTYFIFISGYRNFEYAQEATKYNTIDYITKPFNLSTLENALTQAHKELTADANIHIAYNKTLSMQQYFFSNLLCSSSTGIKITTKDLQEIGLNEDLLKNECSLISIRFENFQKYLDNTWKYGCERLYNAISFILPTDKDLFCSLINYTFDTANLIIINKTQNDAFKTLLDKYLDAFTENIYNLLKLKYTDIKKECFSSVLALAPDKLYANKDSASKMLVEKAKLYIKEHFSENISMNEVAKHISLSPIYFGAFFKQHTGENFSTYLRNVRLEKALNLLKNTEMSIISICEATGYKNTTYFYDLIKSRTGMTPSEYRSKYQHRKGEQNNE